MTARRLRIYIGERDKDPRGKPLYEAIVHEAHGRGLAGATVVKGVCGFGAGSQVHTAKILRLSDDLPLIVEIVDASDKMDAFVAWLREAAPEATATLDDVELVD